VTRTRDAAAPDLVGVAMTVSAAAFFATLGPLAEFGDRAGVGTLPFVTWRAALGAACVGVVLVAARAAGRPSSVVAIRTLPRRDLGFLVGTGLVNAILNFCVFAAFQRVGITLALLVFYLYPAWVALASVLWFGERLDALRWAALALALIGCVLMVAGAGGIGQLDVLGIALAFVAGIGQTLYVLAARHAFSRVPSAQAAVMTMSTAAVLYVLAALVLAQGASLLTPVRGADALWPVVIAGVVGAGASTYLYISGVRRLGPPRAAILALFEPMVAVALAFVLVGERPAAIQLVGGALIVAAAIALQVRPRADLGDHEAV
jgi:drug/metabolite transporter (DMT)-like permease